VSASDNDDNSYAPQVRSKEDYTDSEDDTLETMYVVWAVQEAVYNTGIVAPPLAATAAIAAISLVASQPPVLPGVIGTAMSNAPGGAAGRVGVRDVMTEEKGMCMCP
jgi:hypothetical protein